MKMGSEPQPQGGGWGIFYSCHECGWYTTQTAECRLAVRSVRHAQGPCPSVPSPRNIGSGRGQTCTSRTPGRSLSAAARDTFRPRAIARAFCLACTAVSALSAILVLQHVRGTPGAKWHVLQHVAHSRTCGGTQGAPWRPGGVRTANLRSMVSAVSQCHGPLSEALLESDIGS